MNSSPLEPDQKARSLANTTIERSFQELYSLRRGDRMGHSDSSQHGAVVKVTYCQFCSERDSDDAILDPTFAPQSPDYVHIHLFILNSKRVKTSPELGGP